MTALFTPNDRDVLQLALARSDACATTEELGRLCDADRVGGRDAVVAEHVAGCIRCRSEFALMREFEAAAPRPDEEEAARFIYARLDRHLDRQARRDEPRPGPAPAPRPRWQRFARLRPAVAALALAAAFLVGLDLFGKQASPPALSPGVAEGQAVFRSGGVTLLFPAGEIEEPARELRWQPVPGASSYLVRVTEVDRTGVWTTEARETTLVLPSLVRARNVPGKPLAWQVEARGPNGQVIAVSPVQRFRLKPGATLDPK